MAGRPLVSPAQYAVVGEPTEPLLDVTPWIPHLAGIGDKSQVAVVANHPKAVVVHAVAMPCGAPVQTSHVELALLHQTLAVVAVDEEVAVGVLHRVHVVRHRMSTLTQVSPQ